MMTANLPILCAHLAVLKSLAEQTLPEDCAHLEGTIQLVSWAFQAVARARQRSRDAARQSEALYQRIVEEARRAGLRIVDNHSSQ
jgi:hypothetical protein